MQILNRQNVLATTRRIARPLNRFEMEPILYDLPRTFGNKRARKERIRAYEAAWARLQPEQPGFAQTRQDQYFEHVLIGWLRFHAGMLIGEVIPELYRYLRNNPAAPERALYDHVLVDEYQDLNNAEQAVIDLLAGNASLCIVGDDDQSIYSFKFAHPEGIRTFGQTHAGTTDHVLVDCYRCPTGLVSIANALIANNCDRDGRVLSPVDANGVGTVQIFQFVDVAREARAIAAFIDHKINQEGHAPSDVLVLAQRRVIGTPIHDALRARGVPSKSYYQESELDNEVAQERLAMFKLLINRADRIALRWLLGWGSQDFRAGAYARLRDHCEQEGDSPWEAMSKLEVGELNLPHCRHLVARFHAIKNELRYLEEHTDIADFVNRWLRAEFVGVAELGLLVASLLPAAESAEDLLSKLVEAVTQPEIPPDVTEVRVMSLHKSKGLSAPVVVIAGCIDGLLPAEPDAALPPADQAAMIEEQRRLFYVGLTRVRADPASNKPGVLLLTGSRSLTLADAMQSNIRPARQHYGVVYVHLSRFIPELGDTAPAPEAA